MEDLLDERAAEPDDGDAAHDDDEREPLVEVQAAAEEEHGEDADEEDERAARHLEDRDWRVEQPDVHQLCFMSGRAGWGKGKGRMSGSRSSRQDGRSGGRGRRLARSVSNGDGDGAKMWKRREGGKVGREGGQGGRRKKEKGKRENTYGCAREITERRQPHKQDVGAAEGPAPGRLRRRWRRPMAVRGEQRVLAGVVVGAAVALLVLVRRTGLCPPGGGERVEHGNEACAHARRGRRRRQAGRQARRGEAGFGVG